MTAFYNEIDPYCCDVLRARIADGSLPEGDVDDRDIRTVTAHELRAYDQVHLFAGIGGIPLGLRHAGFDGPILTGGFPCVDLSFAGRGAGLYADRSGLFWEMLAAIRLVRPPLILIENVAALLARGLDVVLGALASIGYDATWHCVPAAHVGAPHIRDRIWILAHPGREHHERGRGERGRPGGAGSRAGPARPGQDADDVAHPDLPRPQGHRGLRQRA